MKISKIKIETIAAKKGWNASTAAAQAGINAQMFSVVKTRGTCRPETALKIARALGVDVTEIMEVD